MQALPISPQGKKPQKKAYNENVEIYRPKNFGDTATHEVSQAAKNMAEEMWREILGIGRAIEQVMTPGVDYAVHKEKHAAQEAPNQENSGAKGAIDYNREILHPENQKEKQESEQRIVQLVQELQQLAKSVKTVERSVIQALGPSVKAQTGKYYESFFEWMIRFVQDARRQVDDSGAWLSAMSSKSRKKQLVGKVKTSMNLFLSGERNVQNQTG